MTTLDRSLTLVAAHEPDEAHVQAAQRKLETAIAAHVARTARAASKMRALAPRRLGGWLVATVSAAVVTVALLWSPLSAPAALAFTTVQQHFRDFRTLRFELDQRMNGQVSMKTRVTLTRAGDVRADVGDDLTVIVNQAERRVLMLQHQARVAVVMPLSAAAERDDALRWLDDVRDFQGVAEALPEVRTIRGARARGWRLEAGGTPIELWANEDGLPLQMVVGATESLQLDFAFEFDADIPPRTFNVDIPEGYSPGTQED
jgi:hypothetical protein